MKRAHASFAAAVIGVAALLVPPMAAIAQDEGAESAAPDVPDVPYSRWLYGFDGSRLPDVALAARYGSPADGMPYDHEISLQPDIRAVTVVHNETVRFVTPEGREFRWKFDTPRTVVSLSRIAPPAVALNANVAVFVTDDAST